MNIIRMQIGDKSNDGHGQWDEFIIETNLTMEEFSNAYNRANKESGIVFHELVASEYQSPEIPDEIVKILGEAMSGLEEVDFEEEEDEWIMMPKGFIEVFCAFIGVYTDYEWEIVPPNTDSLFDFSGNGNAGYGLYI